ncbi:MAG: hypothetical protein ABI342_00525 [Nitrososphaera sp.]|jgi:hypothetical protein
MTVIVTNPIYAQNVTNVKNSSQITLQQQLELRPAKTCCPTDYAESQKTTYLNNTLFWIGVSLAIVGGISAIVVLRFRKITK